MTFVTLTDHNNIEGSLVLREKYPEKTFTGVEPIVYFPEAGCKVHILIYGLSESQFYVIERFRDNIYNLRDYVKEQNLAYSVAHATYSINNKLTIEHIEKLILLFDIFEGVNGIRTKSNNDRWRKLLQNLTPAHLDELYEKHHIEPFSTTPWIKGITGGSDDHAGFFIGKTYTAADAKTPEAFIEALFIFPSTSDTFGMSVLEIQPCGLPSIVSEIGLSGCCLCSTHCWFSAVGGIC